MSNVEKIAPTVHYDIGGKTRRLYYDMWAVAMMENASGQSVMFGKFFTEMSMNKLITLVWGALLEDPEVSEMTEKKGIEAGRKLVAKWVDIGKFDELLEACKKALEAVMPDKNKNESDEGSEGNESSSTKVSGIG